MQQIIDNEQIQYLFLQLYSMPDTDLYQDLMTLLSLIRCSETLFINQILPPHLQNPTLSILTNYSNSQQKAEEIAMKYPQENGELVIKFWMTLRKVLQIFLEKVKLLNVENSFIIKRYNWILERVLKCVERKSYLGQFVELLKLLKNKDQKYLEEILKKEKQEKQQQKHLKLKQQKQRQQKCKEKSKQKTILNIPQKSPAKISKPQFPPTKSPSKKADKKNDSIPSKLFIKKRDNEKVIQNNLITNNKLFRDLDAHQSIQKYDTALDRSSNTHLLFDQLYARNKHAHKSITKYQNHSSSIPKQTKSQLDKYYESVLVLQRGPGKICKSARKHQSSVQGQILPEFEINVIENRNNKRYQKVKARPQSSKVIKRQSEQKHKNHRKSMKFTTIAAKQNRFY